MSRKEDALNLHSKNPGKISVEPSVKIDSKEDLNLVYTPGVAEPCKKIAENKEEVYNYTSKRNLVAIVSDGSAVLGLGDIGGEASMPVMEGKANLMKKFGDVDGFPICLDTDKEKEIVQTVERIAPTFGAINLEDISAPECFTIEEYLKTKLDIPVFHDDQHGTAIVVNAALQNALKLKGMKLKDATITIVGMGAAGVAVTKFLLDQGAEKIIPVDSKGILRLEEGNEYKQELAEKTMAKDVKGSMEDAIAQSDVLIGLSIGDIVTREMVESMNEEPIVFALANPEPEIKPEDAEAAGAFITATGRSDFNNQVNNSLAFPGIFKGSIDAKATEINHEMKKAASETIAKQIEPEKTKIVPETLDKELANKIAVKVAEAAKETNSTR